MDGSDHRKQQTCPLAQDLFNCVTKFEEWGVPYLLHALVCCSLYSYGAITGCLHYYGARRGGGGGSTLTALLRILLLVEPSA